VSDPDDFDTGSQWRVDLATGEAELLLADIRYASRINATQYYVERPRSDIEGPQDGGLGYLVHELSDLELVDMTTGERTRIVSRVSDRVGLAGEGIAFLDAFGLDPGLWAYPLPYDAARSARRPDPTPEPARQLARLAGPRR
jgi:hypothetical protein